MLLVEDDRAISNLLRLYLEKEGIEVTVTYTSETTLLTIKAADFDLMLLDVNLPEQGRIRAVGRPPAAATTCQFWCLPPVTRKRTSSSPLESAPTII